MKTNFFNIDNKLLHLSRKVEEKCQPYFQIADEVSKYNEEKVLNAFSSCKVSESHLKGTTGYGYDDRGREVLDEVFAKIFGCEDALVRHNFVSGTHALTVALFGVLRSGDKMVSITGSPYSTMEEVIGIRGVGNGSLQDFGIVYSQVDLNNDSSINLTALDKQLVDAKVTYIQRSKGYSTRNSICIDDIRKTIEYIRKVNPTTIVIIDNCYGEFVEKLEPSNVGADLIVGSLIKNPGGGIAQTGGYIAGKKDLIKLCAYRLTCVGMGKEIGCSLDQNRALFMGVFFAPSVVASAVKTSIFTLALFDELGYNVHPSFMSKRTDIISAIQLKNKENLIAFCKGIQSGSPIDSFVSPEPWAMPGYDSDVIMAAGAFTMGASIELSADAPLKEPFTVFVQGGLTYHTGKMGILLAAQSMIDSLNIKL